MTSGGRRPKVLRWLSPRDNYETALKRARGASSRVRRRCFVCGFRSAKPVCPRCNTILRPDRAVCATCGKAFDGLIAACDACGAPTELENATREEREAVGSLSSVPGISEERAKGLAAKGFRDFADVVRLALPDSAVRQGLHHTIARKALLADLVPRPPHAVSGARCLMCGAAWFANATRCASCGSSFDLEFNPAAIERRLQEITGDLVNLAADEDFQGMPEDVRNEIMQAFGGGARDGLLREDYSHQIEAWRTKGFDVEQLEPLLEEDLLHFRERSARLIRLQVGKKADSGKYRCPLCEVRLESTAEECGDCGARFS